LAITIIIIITIDIVTLNIISIDTAIYIKLVLLTL